MKYRALCTNQARKYTGRTGGEVRKRHKRRTDEPCEGPAWEAGWPTAKIIVTGWSA